MLEGFLIIVGVYTLLSYLYDNLRTPVSLVCNKWLQGSKQQQIDLMQKYGKWAAVTGSTDGIGKAYARELARLGFNIVLLSIAENDLKRVAHEIETEFGVETFTIHCDFAKGAEIYNFLFKKLSERPIGILVNNVGIGHKPGIVSTFSPEHIWDVININVGAATQLSRFFIDKWQKSGQKGLIVNISSGTAKQPLPYGSVYGAAKAYITSFTKALQEETKDLGISLQLVSPNFVVTNINDYSTKVMRGGLFIPKPDQFAKWAVSTLGRADETTGYFWHGIQIAALNILPYRLRLELVKGIIPMTVDSLQKTRNE